jgi:hypothetical protein
MNREGTMKNPIQRILIVMLPLAAVLGPARSATAETVDQVIASCIQARGGLEKLSAVHSQRLTGHISYGPVAQGAFMVEMKRPGKMRQQITVGGRTQIQTLDGQSGWTLQFDQTRRDLAPMQPAEVRSMQASSDYDGPLVDWKAKGNRVELVGKVKVEGRDAWKLKVRLPGGYVRYDYIDCATHLEVKWEGNVNQNGKPVLFESMFRDFRKVDGKAYAFRIESDAPGQIQQQALVFDKVVLNIPIDDREFGKPSLPPAPPAAAPASKAPTAVKK